MGFKQDLTTGEWVAYYSKRHPITRLPITLRRTGLKDEKEARKTEKQLIVQIMERIADQLCPLWPRAVESCLEAMRNRGVSESTVHDYGTCLRSDTFADWSNKRLDEITTQEIRDLIQLKVGHRSIGHQKNMLKFVRAVFEWAVEDGKIGRNPTPKLNFKTGEKLKAVLTESELRTLLNKARELGSPWYPIWATAVYTGMRSGELFALKWDKVNFETRQIKVDTAWNNKDGFKSTKSGNDRILEIAPPLLTVLKELKLKGLDHDFVLPRIENWERGEQARELRMFLAGLGLPRIRFHDLRASWATILLSKGVEPIKVMKMGGWSDMKTMMIYIRKAGVDIKGATDCLNLHDPSTQTAQVLSFPGCSVL